jgi:antitoxin ParD1/3/4
LGKNLLLAKSLSIHPYRVIHVVKSVSCQSLTILAIHAILLRKGPDHSMPLNVNLTPQLEKLVRQKVSSGRYNSASEVVREALRLMEAQDELRSLKLEQLRRDIREGLDSGPARPWSPSEMKREGRKLLKSRSVAAK